MNSLFLIFNHQITPIQMQDAKDSLGIERIVEMPDALKELWRQIPSDKELWRQIPSDLAEIGDYLIPLKEWLLSQAVKGDYVLIQGDFGACFIMVSTAFDMGLIPVYSTTKREAFEEHGEDGAIRLVHQVKHECFRKYGH